MIYYTVKTSFTRAYLWQGVEEVQPLPWLYEYSFSLILTFVSVFCVDALFHTRYLAAMASHYDDLFVPSKSEVQLKCSKMASSIHLHDQAGLRTRMSTASSEL